MRSHTVDMDLRGIKLPRYIQRVLDIVRMYRRVQTIPSRVGKLDRLSIVLGHVKCERRPKGLFISKLHVLRHPCNDRRS